MLSAVFAMVSCDMDFYRSDTLTSAMLKENPGAATYTTDGVYSMFKDVLSYNGSEYSANQYVRHLLLSTELRGDNAAVSFATSDKLLSALLYNDLATHDNIGYFWYVAYKILYGANSNIESIQEGASVESDHMLGENYFIRAIVHLHLSTIFSKPYTLGNQIRRDNPGVVLRTSTNCKDLSRSTVGQVYDQIVSDLQKAMELMEKGTRRGDAGFASYNAARGLLTRVYLYMGQNKDAITLANDMLGADPTANLVSGEDLYDYFATARDSKETLWCIARELTDKGYSAGSQVGSMYYKPVTGFTSTGTPIEGDGWGEIFYSETLLDVYARWPEDLRFKAYCYKKLPVEGEKMIYWPVAGESSVEGSAEKLTFYSPITADEVTYNESDDTYSFKYGNKKYTAMNKTINKSKVWYVESIETDSPKDSDGHVRVYVRDAIEGQNKNFPAWMMRKFADQDGEAQLCSPVMIRWAEVILNRAEANAKEGHDQLALDDVNVLRKRAGLPEEAMYTLSNYQDWGYESVLDVVLEERNLELCFEGHRAIDLYRNGKSINRQFPGVHPWGVLSTDYLEQNFAFCIPFGEVSISGEQNNK